MLLTGGNYGNYILEGNSIKIEDTILNVIFTENKNEFYVVDDNNDAWNYRIDSDIAIFTGVNKI
jgi:hypothetical protein